VSKKDKDKKSFLIYLDYEEHFNLLTDEQLGKLMRAIIKYEKNGETSELDQSLKIAFSFIKTQLDIDREKYKLQCEKNKENGSKGGRPKKSDNESNNDNNKDDLKEEEKKSNGFEEKQIDKGETEKTERFWRKANG